MKAQADPLYIIFEQHLLNALVEEETTEEFLNHVVRDYLARIGENSTIPHDVRPMVEEDLREEVMEMLRKKTYGNYSIKEYRMKRGAGATKAQSLENKPASEAPQSKIEAKPKMANGRLHMRRPRRTN